MQNYEAEGSENAKRTISYFMAQVQWYGVGLLGCILFLATILKGMPLHQLWPLFGTITLIATLFFFIKTVQFAGMALSSWWLEWEFRRKGESKQLTSSDYSPPKARSGRRRGGNG
jgi:energy-coupling factor transporter transmembrane protein EcfT